jgi:hypothetical protein
VSAAPGLFVFDQQNVHRGERNLFARLFLGNPLAFGASATSSTLFND